MDGDGVGAVVGPEAAREPFFCQGDWDPSLNVFVWGIASLTLFDSVSESELDESDDDESEEEEEEEEEEEQEEEEEEDEEDEEEEEEPEEEEELIVLVDLGAVSMGWVFPTLVLGERCCGSVVDCGVMTAGIVMLQADWLELLELDELLLRLEVEDPEEELEEEDELEELLDRDRELVELDLVLDLWGCC